MLNIEKIYKILKQEFTKYKAPIIDLIEMQTKDPFKILVGTILSARTKDKTTAEVTNRLFLFINNPTDLNKYSIEEIEEMIYPVGFFRNKAKQLKKLPEVLKNKFDNQIPDEIDKLVQLPGVGRKTANLVRTIAFKKPAICVDTRAPYFKSSRLCKNEVSA